MEAHNGTNPSYTWRSLIAGREALKEGLAWRIGDGVSVDIRNHKWIPTLSNMLVQNPDAIPHGLQSIQQLINHEA